MCVLEKRVIGFGLCSCFKLFGSVCICHGLAAAVGGVGAISGVQTRADGLGHIF